MRILRVEIKNFSNHRDTALDFRPGINGIVGPNGSGKSSVLDAIRFGITGSSIGEGVSADNVTWGQKSGSVTVTFVHGDTEYRIERRVGKKAGQALTWPGHELVKQAEIEAHLSGVLDTSLDALLNNVFVPQGQIDAILFHQTTARLKEIQKTVGLDHLADAERLLGLEIGAQNVTVGLREQLEAASASLAGARTALAQARAEQAVLEARVAELLPAKQQFDRILAARQVRVAVEAAEARVKAAAAEWTRTQTVLAGLQTDYGTIQAAVAAQAPAATEARQALALAEQARRQRVLIAQLRAEVSDATVTLAEIQPVPDRAHIDTLRAQAQVLGTKAASLRDMATGRVERKRAEGEVALAARVEELRTQELKWVSAGVVVSPRVIEAEARAAQLDAELKIFRTGECPTCHQPVARFDAVKAAADIAKLRAAATQARELAAQEFGSELARIRSNRVLAQAELDRYAAVATEYLAGAAATAATAAAEAEGAVTAAQTRFDAAQTLTTRIRTAEARIADVAGAETEAGDLSTYQACVQSYDAAKARLDALGVEVGIRAEAVTAAEKAVTAAVQERRRLGDVAGEPEADLADLEAKAKALAAAVAEREQVGVQLGTLSARETHFAGLVAQLVATTASEQQTMTWVDLCRRVRACLHVSALPSLLMREYAAVLNRRMEHYLEIWEAPFTLRLSADLEFVVETNGFVAPAGRLSGGQKIVAATSFRLAMADTFARTVGLLVLDEPSTYLDRDNIVHLQNLLLRLKTLAGASGRQVILVTHEDGLMNFFDHSIQLFKP